MNLEQSGQLSFFAEDEVEQWTEAARPAKASRTGSFVDNMQLPIHGWFRYSAGFSAQWVEQVIKEMGPRHGVLDPFVGSATTLLASEKCRTRAVGMEAHPFVCRVAGAKLSWNVQPPELLQGAELLLSIARDELRSEAASPEVLLRKCYDGDTLRYLEALRSSYGILSEEKLTDTKVNRMLWLAITSILRECSPAGTATWQYVLPKSPSGKRLSGNSVL